MIDRTQRLILQEMARDLETRERHTIVLTVQAGDVKAVVRRTPSGAYGVLLFTVDEMPVAGNGSFFDIEEAGALALKMVMARAEVPV